MKTRMMRLLLAMGLLAFTLPLHATTNVPLTTDDTWAVPNGYDESIGGVGGFFNEDWSFTLPAWGGVLTVTDEFVVGDSYDVYDQGTLIADIPWVTDWSTIPGCDNDAYDASCGYTLDPNVALASPYFAHALIDLGSGYHDITIEELTEPTGFTDSTVNLNVSAPEPSTLTLLGLGSLAAGLLKRRKTNRAA